MTETVEQTIHCRYSASSGFEIVASDSLLQSIAEMLEESGLSIPHSIPCKNNSPTEPYDELIKFIAIERSTGLLRILYAPGLMRIIGDGESMHLLAENINSFASGTSSHLHVEHYPGHFYIDRESEPLILTRA